MTKSALPIRSETWVTKELHQFLTANANKPFAWGEFDCCLFAANAIQAITGVDIAEDFRGKYHDEASAFELIKSVTGGTTVADAAAYCANKHGMSEWVHPLFAQRGDLVVFTQSPGNLMAGIITLSGTHVVSVSAEGLIKTPITTISRAWRIPTHAQEKLPASRLRTVSEVPHV